MTQASYKAPTGLTVVMREFMVEDEDLLADPKLVRSGMALTSLLTATTVGIQDVGPYKLTQQPQGEVLDWRLVAEGDRFYLLMQNRIRTWGANIDVNVPCPKCENMNKFEIELDKMKVKELPEHSLNHIKTGAPLKVRLPSSNAVVSFRLLRGGDEPILQKIQKDKKQTRSSSLLQYRILSVEGVKPQELPKWIRGLTSRESGFLRAAFDQSDCGVDPAMQFECHCCSHSWVGDVELREDFLFPKWTKKIEITT